MKEPGSLSADSSDFPDDVLRRRVKSELRKRMRGLRAATPESACAERSSRIVARLLDLLQTPELAVARGVALFWPITARHEVDLRALDTTLRAKNVRLYYPAIDRVPAPPAPTEPPEPADLEPESLVMTFKEVADVAALAEAGFGFAEPPADAHLASPPRAGSPAEIDVIVVPALAVDPAGYRIGYGKGYYDQTLPRFAPPAITIAVAYDFQLISEVPVTAGDVAVDWVVTDARVFRAEPAGQASGAEE